MCAGGRACKVCHVCMCYTCFKYQITNYTATTKTSGTENSELQNHSLHDEARGAELPIPNEAPGAYVIVKEPHTLLSLAAISWPS